MALATQCPHCHTTFKVAHDQLKLRAGLVRCGACKQIFNGIEHLVPPEPVPKPASLKTVEKAAVKSAPLPEPVRQPTPARTSPHTAPSPPLSPPVEKSADAPVDRLDFIPVDDPETETRILSSPLAKAPPVAEHSSSATSFDSSEEDPLTRMTLVDFSAFQTEESEEQDEDKSKEPDDGHGELPLQAAAGEPAVPPQKKTEGNEKTEASTSLPQANLSAPVGTEVFSRPYDAEPTIIAQPVADPPLSQQTVFRAAEPDALPSDLFTEDSNAEKVDSLGRASENQEEPDFVIRARRHQRIQSVLRVVLSVASIILLAAALVQSAYIFRSQLAAWFPQTKPLLSELCTLLECQVDLPTQIDLVSLESSELQAQPDNKNAFTLTLLLHNRSQVAQAWPHIELTLNDSSEKPLVRRVLFPREYLPPETDMAKGFSAQSEVPVKVHFELAEVQASGYRVYLFYP